MAALTLAGLLASPAARAEASAPSCPRAAASCLYVAPGGSDTAAGTAAAPFATLGKALAATSGGEVVYVAEGTYPPVVDRKQRSAPVTVRGYPAPPGPASDRPTVTSALASGRLISLRLIGSSNLRFENLTFLDNVDVSSYAHDIRFARSLFTGSEPKGSNCMRIQTGPYDIAIQESRFSGCVTSILGGNSSDFPHDIRIEDNVFEDSVDGLRFAGWRRVTVRRNLFRRLSPGTTGFHSDGIQLAGLVEQLEIARNVFSNIEGQFLIFQQSGSYPGPNVGIRVLNNLMHDNATYGVQISDTRDVEFVHNTIWNTRYSALLVRRRSSGTVVANNILTGFVRDGDAQLSYHDYNVIGYRPAGDGPIKRPLGRHDIVTAARASSTPAGATTACGTPRPLAAPARGTPATRPGSTWTAGGARAHRAGAPTGERQRSGLYFREPSSSDFFQPRAYGGNRAPGISISVMERRLQGAASRPSVRVVFVLAFACALAAPLAAVGALAGPTELISHAPGDNAPVTARGFGDVSADGRYVALNSAGRDLDPSNANPFDDVYVLDRQASSFDRVSKSSGGGDGNGASTIRRGGLSSDGRFVAFASTASNLVGSDNNLRSDVFVRDRQAGTTQLVSRNATGLDANGSAGGATISDSGARVAFASDAPDMLSTPDLGGNRDVFVHDLTAGTTQLVSANLALLPGSGSSGNAAISGDGTKVAFESTASDLVAGDTNGKTDVFVRDLASGQTTRVTVANTGAQSNGDSADPFISDDGRYAGFSSVATNLGGVSYVTNGSNVYVRDLTAGRTERVIPESGIEQRNGHSVSGSFSADGRYLAFVSSSTEFSAGDRNNQDVFVLDRATDEIEIATQTFDGKVSNGHSTVPAIAGGVTGVGFLSTASNLVSDMTGSFNPQVYFRPLTPDAVAADIDGDGVPNVEDVCPTAADPGQQDTDGDGRGNACDPDDDADRVPDTLEPSQGTDPGNRDTDGDGVDDFFDDYPTDPSRQFGTEHRTLNVAQFEGADGKAAAELDWKVTASQFAARVTGTLLPNTTYLVVAFRRAPGIREQLACSAKTNAQGALACTRSVNLSFFTHLELRRGTTVIDTVDLENNRRPPLP